jgi:hypothetical protein
MTMTATKTRKPRAKKTADDQSGKLIKREQGWFLTQMSGTKLDYGPYDTKADAEQERKQILEALAAVADDSGAPPITEGEAKRLAKKATAAKAENAAEDGKPGRGMSLLDAAAALFTVDHEPKNCKDIIAALALSGAWVSPGGKTPHATLYSAILREISVKGKASRFVRADKGKFGPAK